MKFICYGHPTPHASPALTFLVKFPMQFDFKTCFLLVLFFSFVCFWLGEGCFLSASSVLPGTSRDKVPEEGWVEALAQKILGKTGHLSPHATWQLSVGCGGGSRSWGITADWLGHGQRHQELCNIHWEQAWLGSSSLPRHMESTICWPRTLLNSRPRAHSSSFLLHTFFPRAFSHLSHFCIMTVVWIKACITFPVWHWYIAGVQ